MSLIHKMLRDLEEHTKKNNVSELNVQPALQSKNNSDVINYSTMLRRGLLSILLIALISAVFLLQKEHMNIFSLLKKNKVVLSKTAAPMTTTVAMPEPSAQSHLNIKSVLPLDPKDKSNLLYQQSIDFIGMGNISQAILSLAKAIQLDPTFQKAREALIVLLIQQNHLNQANDVANDGLALSPGNVAFLKLKAHVLIAQHRYKDAITLLSDNAINIQKNTDYYALLAAAYENNKDYMTAAKIYRELVDVQSYNGNFWFGLGVSLQNANKKAAAKEAFQKALQAGGLSPQIHAYLETQIQME